MRRVTPIIPQYRNLQNSHIPHFKMREFSQSGTPRSVVDYLGFRISNIEFSRAIARLILFSIVVLFITCASFQARFMNLEDRSAEIFEEGNNHFKKKEYEKAIIELEKIVREYTKTQAYEPALYLLTFSYYRLNSFERTVFYGERFVKEFPYSNYLIKVLGMLGEANLKLINDYKAAYYLIKFHKQSTDVLENESAYKKIIQLLSEMSLDNLEKLHRNFLGEPIDEHILYYLIKIEIKAGQEKNAERDVKLLTRRFPETIYAEEFTDFNKFDVVDAQCLEIALYKATATLNETNHAAILKKLGTDEGIKLIDSIETRAKHDVSMILFNELEKISDELSPEMQDVVRKLSEIKKKIDSGQPLNKEDLENLQKGTDGIDY